MFRKILFASDLGVYTPYIMQHVIGMANQHEAKIVVLHAVEPLTHMADAVVNTYMSAESKEELEKGGLERIIAGIKQQIIESFEDDFIDGNRGLNNIRDVLVIRGKPADVILQESSRIDPDLIVLGSHGQFNENPNVLGSVASKVLQLAKKPVFMVPVTSPVFSKGPDQGKSVSTF